MLSVQNEADYDKKNEQTWLVHLNLWCNLVLNWYVDFCNKFGWIWIANIANFGVTVDISQVKKVVHPVFSLGDTMKCFAHSIFIGLATNKNSMTKFSLNFSGTNSWVFIGFDPMKILWTKKISLVHPIKI